MTKLLLHYNEINPRVIKEIRHAVEKHGMQEELTLEQQYVILMEEIGEVAKAILDGNDLSIEIYQCIAMLVKLDYMKGK